MGAFEAEPGECTAWINPPIGPQGKGRVPCWVVARLTGQCPLTPEERKNQPDCLENLAAAKIIDLESRRQARTKHS